MRESSADTLQITTGGTLALTLDSSQNATFAGAATIPSQITAGYGIKFTNGNTDFLLYNNSNEDVLYMRDTTNGAMITTWKTDRFQSDKDFVAMEKILVAGGSISNQNGVQLAYSGNYAVAQLNGVTGSFIDFSDSSTDYKGRIIYTNSNNKFKFYTNATQALEIDSSQNATFAGDITVSGGDITLGGTGRIQGVDTVSAGTDAANKTYVDAQVNAKTESFILACSDETTDLTASNSVAKVTFRMPYAFTLTNVRANVNTAPEGSTLTVDIKRSGTSIFSTALTIANGSKTSVGGTAYEFTGSADTMGLADDAEITVFCTSVGSTTAGKGLKVTLIGNQ
jgi:hypothetical protein